MLPAVAAISKGKVAKFFTFLPFYPFTFKKSAAIHHGPQTASKTKKMRTLPHINI
jgi:hypothetical protein